jgi:hypothetical protein
MHRGEDNIKMDRKEKKRFEFINWIHQLVPSCKHGNNEP